MRGDRPRRESKDFDVKRLAILALSLEIESSVISPQALETIFVGIVLGENPLARRETFPIQPHHSKSLLSFLLLFKLSVLIKKQIPSTHTQCDL